MFLSLPAEVDEAQSAVYRTAPSSDEDATSSDDERPRTVRPATAPRDRTPRCCSVGRRLEMEDFRGNVMPAAVCLADVDNDGTNELVVGSTDGELAVYKGLEKRSAWRRAEGLGSIACCAAAEGLLWAGHCSLAVITVEGWLHLFHLFPDWRTTLPASRGAHRGRRPQPPPRFAPVRSRSPLRPVHTERIPLNGCTLLLRKRGKAASPRGGGCELCVGSTDGTVYSLLLSNASSHPPRLSLTLRIMTEWSVAFPLRSLFLQPKPAHTYKAGQAPTAARATSSGADSAQAAREEELCCCVQNRVGGYFVLDPPPPAKTPTSQQQHADSRAEQGRDGSGDSGGR